MRNRSVTKILFLCIFLPKNKKIVSFDVNDYAGYTGLKMH